MTEQKFQTQLKRVYKQSPFQRHFERLLHTFAETHWDEPMAPFIFCLSLQELNAMIEFASENDIEIPKIELENAHAILNYHDRLGL